ncbi:MAG: winged helix-turn-helix domain-containing protein [Lachnospiraceae bacterium]
MSERQVQRLLKTMKDELAILKAMANNPSITQKELVAKVGKSERTIKSKTIELQKKGYIQRVNGKRNGLWKVLKLGREI